MTIWSPRPSSLTRSLTMGLRVAKDSAPESRSRPPTSWAPTAPPRWCRCSSRVTRMPAAARRRAEMRPEGPPPITMAVGTFSLRVKVPCGLGRSGGADLCGPVWCLVGVLAHGGSPSVCQRSALWRWRYQRVRWLGRCLAALICVSPAVRCFSFAVFSWMYATRSVSTCGSVVGVRRGQVDHVRGAALPSASTSSTCA